MTFKDLAIGDVFKFLTPAGLQTIYGPFKKVAPRMYVSVQAAEPGHNQIGSWHVAVEKIAWPPPPPNTGRYISLKEIEHANFDVLKEEVRLIIETFERNFGRRPQVLHIRALEILPPEKKD